MRMNVMYFRNRLYGIGLDGINMYANKNARLQNQMADKKLVLSVFGDLFKKWWSIGKKNNYMHDSRDG